MCKIKLVFEWNHVRATSVENFWFFVSLLNFSAGRRSWFPLWSSGGSTKLIPGGVVLQLPTLSGFMDLQRLEVSYNEVCSTSSQFSML